MKGMSLVLIALIAATASGIAQPAGQDLLSILAACSAKSADGIQGNYTAPAARRKAGRTWLHVSRAADGKFIVKSRNDFSILVLTEVNSYTVDGMNIVVTTMQTTSTMKYDPVSKSLSGTFPSGSITYSLTGC